jgi:hypothetical protein
MNQPGPRPVIDAEYEIIEPKPRERPSPVWLFVAAFVLFSGLLWGAWIGQPDTQVPENRCPL